MVIGSSVIDYVVTHFTDLKGKDPAPSKEVTVTVTEGDICTRPSPRIRQLFGSSNEAARPCDTGISADPPPLIRSLLISGVPCLFSRSSIEFRSSDGRGRCRVGRDDGNSRAYALQDIY